MWWRILILESILKLNPLSLYSDLSNSFAQVTTLVIWRFSCSSFLNCNEGKKRLVVWTCPWSDKLCWLKWVVWEEMEDNQLNFIQNKQREIWVLLVLTHDIGIALKWWEKIYVANSKRLGFFFLLFVRIDLCFFWYGVTAEIY